MTQFAKAFDPNQARDADGRWTEAGENGADALDSIARTGDRSSIRDLGRAAMAMLHAKATDLAGKIKHFVTSTRLSHVAPTAGGGIEIAATHGLPAGQGRIRSYLQIQPHMIPPNAQRALVAVHHGLLANSVRAVPTKSPPIGASFVNGPAPMQNFGKSYRKKTGRTLTHAPGPIESRRGYKVRGNAGRLQPFVPHPSFLRKCADEDLGWHVRYTGRLSQFDGYSCIVKDQE
jgi:hypothetical protein